MSKRINEELKRVLINESIKCRSFKVNDETIIVNMITPTRTICFSCDLNQLKEKLDVPAFKLMPLITEVGFINNRNNKVVVNEDLYFIKDEIYNNSFVGELNNGTFIKSPMSKLYFEYIFLTTKEYAEIILASIEEF